MNFLKENEAERMEQIAGAVSPEAMRRRTCAPKQPVRELLDGLFWSLTYSDEKQWVNSLWIT